MAVETNIRVMIARVRRALVNAGASSTITDDEVKDLTADAIAEVILYTGGVFGKQLLVTQTDATTGAPTEYATSDALTLAEQSVIASQAALNHFFREFAGRKVSERIADEAQQWEYALSPQLLTAQLRLLIDDRDKALAALEADHSLDSYESFIAVRDALTSKMIEPWVHGLPVACGQEDFRFGTWG